MGLPVPDVIGLPAPEVMGLPVPEVMGLPEPEVMGLPVAEVMGFPVPELIVALAPLPLDLVVLPDPEAGVLPEGFWTPERPDAPPVGPLDLNEPVPTPVPEPALLVPEPLESGYGAELYVEPGTGTSFPVDVRVTGLPEPDPCCPVDVAGRAPVVTIDV